MKKTIYFALIFLALALSACGVVRGSGHVITETRSIDDFDQITMAAIGEVIVSQGDEVSLKIEAEDNLMPYLESVVHGNNLILRSRDSFPNPSLWATKPIKFYVTAVDIESITITGAGDLSAKKLLSEEMNIDVFGSGDIHLDQLDTKSVSMKIAGSGDIEIEDLTADEIMTTITGSGSCNLEGDTEVQALRITGSGNYRASELKSEIAKVNIIGSGSGYIMVNTNLDVRITGSGDLRYVGSPQVSQSIIGSGNVLAK